MKPTTRKQSAKVGLWLLMLVAFAPPGAFSSEEGALTANEALSVLGGIGQVNDADTGFLPPDVAFQFLIEFVNTNTIVARWEMAETYYLYRDKLNFALHDSSGTRLGEVVIPSGEVKHDAYFGSVEVFYESVQASLLLDEAGPRVDQVTLDVTYQGCTDLGLCYPPITKTVTLSAPPSAN